MRELPTKLYVRCLGCWVEQLAGDINQANAMAEAHEDATGHVRWTSKGIVRGPVTVEPKNDVGPKLSEGKLAV